MDEEQKVEVLDMPKKGLKEKFSNWLYMIFGKKEDKE